MDRAVRIAKVISLMNRITKNRFSKTVMPAVQLVNFLVKECRYGLDHRYLIEVDTADLNICGRVPFVLTNVALNEFLRIFAF